jgi:hypothetical protein
MANSRAGMDIFTDPLTSDPKAQRQAEEVDEVAVILGNKK